MINTSLIKLNNNNSAKCSGKEDKMQVTKGKINLNLFYNFKTQVLI